MAFILELTNGTDIAKFVNQTEFYLEDGGFELAEPELIQTWGDPVDGGGSKLLSSIVGNRTATLTFEIRATTLAGIQSSYGKLKRIITSAINYQLGKSSNRVSLAYSWDSAVDTTYFEVFSGQFSWPSDLMSVNQIHTQINGKYAVSGCKLELVLSSSAFGQDPSVGTMIEVGLKNPNSSGGGVNYDTGGLEIGDFTDGRTYGGFYHANYVDILGSSITGVLDAPAKIMIGGNTATDACDRFAIGITERTTIKYQFNGWGDADLIPRIVTGTQVANTDSVDGNYRSMTFNKSQTEYRLLSLEIDTPDTYGSDLYRVILHSAYLFNCPDSLYRIKITTPVNITPLFISEWQSGGANGQSNWVDLGVIPLPPSPDGITNIDKLYVDIYMVDSVGTGTHTLNLNYVCLIPVSKAYRVLVSNVDTQVMSTYSTVVDDGWSGLSWAQTTDATPKKAPVVVPLFSPILLTPGVNQRIIIDPTGSLYASFYQGNADIYTLSVFYTPVFYGEV